jgi:hypothetical protein
MPREANNNAKKPPPRRRSTRLSLQKEQKEAAAAACAEADKKTASSNAATAAGRALVPKRSRSSKGSVGFNEKRQQQSSKTQAAAGRKRAPKRSRSSAGTADQPLVKKARRGSRTRGKRPPARRSNPDHNMHAYSSPSTFTAGISHYDTRNAGDTLQAPELVSDIFQRLYLAEVSFS